MEAEGLGSTGDFSTFIYHLLRLRLCVLVTQSCPALCDSMDDSPPGSSVHGIIQARILEWVAILSSSLYCNCDNE